MAPKPQAERHPPGLDAYWTHVWEHALKIMREQGTWAWEQRPLLDEYVFALIEAQAQREDGKPTAWDRAARRASVLADQLVLTPKAQRAFGVGSESPGPEDDFEALDELAERRDRSQVA